MGERTVFWSAPDVTQALRDPVGHMLSIRDGLVPRPPLYELLRIEVIHAEVGRVKLGITPDESFLSPLGTVGGGVLMTALDTTLAWACQTRVPAGLACTTLEMKTNFFRPVEGKSTRLIVEGESIFNGSRILVAQGQIKDAAAKIVAVATATCMMTTKT